MAHIWGLRGSVRRAFARACCAWSAVLALVAAAAGQTTFTEEALQRGVDYVVVQGAFGGTGQYGCGVAVADLDGDGDQDLIVTGAENDLVGVFENDGRGQFTDRSQTSGIGVLFKVSGVAAGDMDGDGDLDLAFTRWLKLPALFRNDGGMHFVDATSTSGFTGINGAGAGAAWGDYDGDGRIDLAIANRTGTFGAPLKNRLYRNLGGGAFVDVAPALGVDSAFASFQASWCDLDQDGDLDLYVANDKGTAGVSWNQYYRNVKLNGATAFVQSPGSGAQISLDAMGVVFGDLDGDAWPDLYIANVPTGNVLLKAQPGGQTFVDATIASGTAANATCWGGIAWDPDQDGDTDLLTAANAPHRLFAFERTGPWPFVERSAAWGLGQPGDGYCLARGDLDGDGDEDLVHQCRGERIRIYINHVDALPDRHWISFRVVGRGADLYAIGASILVQGPTVHAWRQVEAGSGYKSQSSYLLHVGLGPATTAETVTVRWPNTPAADAQRLLTSYPAGRVWTVWPVARLGDIDGDGAFDHVDRSWLLARLDQPFEPGSEIVDFDGDADVDCDDEAAFLARYCDLDRDGVVGPRDLAELLGRWAKPAASAADGDFDADGVVGAGDLALLVAGWS